MANDNDPLASEIAVPSEDPKKNDNQPKTNGDVKGKGKDDVKGEADIVCISVLSRHL